MPLFAISSGWDVFLLALGGALGGLITTLFTNLGKFMDLLKTNNREDAKLKEEQAKSVEQRLQSHIDRLEREIRSNQQSLAVLHQEYTESLIETADIYGFCVRMRDVARRLQRKLKDMGMELGEEVPNLPARRQRKPFDVEFVQRTEEHNTSMVKAADDVVKKQMESKNTVPPDATGGSS